MMIPAMMAISMVCSRVPALAAPPFCVVAEGIADSVPAGSEFVPS